MVTASESLHLTRHASRDRVCTARFFQSASTNVSAKREHGTPFPFPVSSRVQPTRCRYSATIAMHREIEISALQRTVMGPLQQAQAERASCRSADVNGQFRSCVPSRSIGHCGGFNVYTRTMYVSSAICTETTLVSASAFRTQDSLSVILNHSGARVFRLMPDHSCAGYLISVRRYTAKFRESAAESI